MFKIVQTRLYKKTNNSLLVDRKYFLFILKKYIYTLLVDKVVNSNIQTSTHPLSYQSISGFVYLHLYLY